MGPKEIDYKPLHIFLRAFCAGNKWENTHYFIPMANISSNTRFPGIKVIKLEVVEIDTKKEVKEVQRFLEQYTLSSAESSIPNSIQNTADKVIENMIKRIIQYYGNIV